MAVPPSLISTSCGFVMFRHDSNLTQEQISHFCFPEELSYRKQVPFESLGTVSYSPSIAGADLGIHQGGGGHCGGRKPAAGEKFFLTSRLLYVSFTSFLVN